MASNSNSNNNSKQAPPQQQPLTHLQPFIPASSSSYNPDKYEAATGSSSSKQCKHRSTAITSNCSDGYYCPCCEKNDQARQMYDINVNEKVHEQIFRK